MPAWVPAGLVAEADHEASESKCNTEKDSTVRNYDGLAVLAHYFERLL